MSVKKYLHQSKSGFAALATACNTNTSSLPTNMTSSDAHLHQESLTWKYHHKYCDLNDEDICQNAKHETITVNVHNLV